MTDNIQMNTTTGGGLFSGRVSSCSLSGGGMFVVDYTATAPARIAFAARFPGQILPFTLKPGEQMVCRKETFLCAEKSVTLDIAFQQRLGAGFFGGEGFILQRVTGPGTVWLDLSGEVVTEDLAPGQRLLVHAGHVGVQSAGDSVPAFKWFADSRTFYSAAKDCSWRPSPAQAASGSKACR